MTFDKSNSVPAPAAASVSNVTAPQRFSVEAGTRLNDAPNTVVELRSPNFEFRFMASQARIAKILQLVLPEVMEAKREFDEWERAKLKNKPQ